MKMGLILLLLNLNVHAQSIVTIQGTLVKNENKWLLFVNQGQMPVPKGMIELKFGETLNKKVLTEKSLVDASGRFSDCEKKKCFEVVQIQPAIRK